MNAAISFCQILAQEIAPSHLLQHYWLSLAYWRLALDTTRSPAERVDSVIKLMAHRAHLSSKTVAYDFLGSCYYTARIEIPGEKVLLEVYLSAVDRAVKQGWFPALAWQAAANKRVAGQNNLEPPRSIDIDHALVGA